MNSHCSSGSGMKEDKYSRGWGTGKILTFCAIGKARKGAKKGIPPRRRNPKPRKRNTSLGGCASGGSATAGISAMGGSATTGISAMGGSATAGISATGSSATGSLATGDCRNFSGYR